MKEFVEKLIARLEEYKYVHLVEHDKEMLEHCTENERTEHCDGIDCFWCVWDKSISIVKELAEEYDNNWIPCSERLPDKYCHCLVTRRNDYEDGFDTDVREDVYIELEGVWGWQSNFEGLIDNIIAWQPLPNPYKPTN